MRWLVLLLAFCKVGTLLGSFGDKAVQKAFENILKSISTRDRFVTIVTRGVSNDETDFALYKLVNFPQVVARLGNDWTNFTLNSTSIVSLDSVESLRAFTNTPFSP